MEKIWKSGPTSGISRALVDGVEDVSGHILEATTVYDFGFSLSLPDKSKTTLLHTMPTWHIIDR